MKKRILTIFIVLMVCFGVFSSLTISAKSEIKGWKWDDKNFEVIADENGLKYYLVDLPYGCEIVGTNLIVYSHNLNRPDDIDQYVSYAYEIYSIMGDTRVISLGLNENMVYVREDYINDFKEFLNGKLVYTIMLDREKNKNIPFGNDLVDMLLSNTEKVVMDVTEFQNEYYTIYNCDDTFFTGIATYTIFRKDSSYFYAVNSELDNSRFDASGNISLRKGEIEVYKIDSELSKMIEASIRAMRYNYRDITIEYDEFENIITGDLTGSLPAFLAAIISIGLVLPLFPFVFGLILTIKNRKNKDKNWIIIPILSVIWMVAATIILIILL